MLGLSVRWALRRGPPRHAPYSVWSDLWKSAARTISVRIHLAASYLPPCPTQGPAGMTSAVGLRITHSHAANAAHNQDTRYHGARAASTARHRARHRTSTPSSAEPIGNEHEITTTSIATRMATSHLLEYHRICIDVYGRLAYHLVHIGLIHTSQSLTPCSGTTASPLGSA